MSIGENIKNHRKENKLTQKELADKSNISRSYLADIENDRYNPSLDVLKSISKSLDVQLSDLINENNYITQENQSNYSSEHKNNTLESNFVDPQEALQFILKQPLFLAYGGYDLNEMSDEGILEIANDMLLAMKISIERRKKK